MKARIKGKTEAKHMALTENTALTELSTGPERWSDLPKVTKMTDDRARVQTQTGITPKHCLPDPRPLISEWFVILPQLLQTTTSFLFAQTKGFRNTGLLGLKLGQLATLQRLQPACTARLSKGRTSQT